MSDPIKQHFVPKSYIKHWENERGLVWYFDLAKREYREANKGKILKYKHLYSLASIELDLWDIDDRVELLAPIEGIQVCLNGNKLVGIDILRNLSQYKSFVMIDSSGKTIRAKHQKDLMDKVFNQMNFSIEKRFQAFEDSWDSTVDFFERYREQKLFGKPFDGTDQDLHHHLESLKQFMLLMYTRNPYQFQASLERIKKRDGVSLTSNQAKRAFKQVQLSLLDNKRTFFNMDRYKVNMVLAVPGQCFISSDNPVVIRGIELVDLDISAIMWFPVSPNIFAVLSEKKPLEVLSNGRELLVQSETITDINQIVLEGAYEAIFSKYEIPALKFRLARN